MSMYAERALRVAANMARENLPQIIVTSTPSVFYLTGLWIEPYERLLALLVDKDGRRTLFGNALFAIDEDAQDFPCVLHTDSDDPVARLAAALLPGAVGIDKNWPSRFLLGLLSHRDDLSPRLGSGPVDRARMLKDAEEIALLRRASRMNDQVVQTAVTAVREGITEIEMAKLLTSAYENLGADYPVGPLGVAFGANAADPHHSPDSSAALPGECALFDITARFSRYWCDMTRTVWLGSIDPEAEKAYQTVLKANEAAIAAIKPGLPLREVDRVARDIIAGAGYGPNFTHRLGHGAGLDVHEPPDVSAASSIPCEPGMVFSVEPGIYLPGRFGVRIEDLVLVTESGAERLNQAGKELLVR